MPPYLWPVVVIVLVFYVLAPLLVFATQWHRAEVEFAPTRVDDLPHSVRANVARMVQELAEVGFAAVSNVRTADQVPGVLGIQLLFVHPQTLDVAYGIYSGPANLPAAATSALADWTMTIRAHFTDGTQIVTAASPSPSVFPPDPLADVINAAWIRDPKLLFAIHRARVYASGRLDYPRIVPMPGDEIGFQQREFRAEMDRVAAAGYFRLDASGTRFRMTLSGAYLMTWRMLWPVKSLRNAARRRRAARVIRGLGLTA